jgi:hypothetical protein
MIDALVLLTACAVLHVASCRLVLARHYLLAYRVAEMLGGAGKEEVLLHWAAAKISASPSVPDASLKEALAAKVSLMDRPKYAPLAAHAQVSRSCRGTC